MTLGDLILSAREAAKLKKWNKSERLYKRVIRSLAKKKNNSLVSKQLYLSTKAEYLCQKPYCPDRESLDEYKCRIFNAIRHLNECVKINNENSKHCLDSMHELVQHIIKLYGCGLLETKDHVALSCPIKLRSDHLGSMGGSIGVTYKKMLCSVCDLDMLDEKCTHSINQVYDGKRCSPIYEGLQIKDVSLVNRPKDPLCQVTDVYYPKQIFLQKAGLDASKSALKQKLGIQCTHCRDENIDSSSITPEIFFRIHGLNITTGKSELGSAMKDFEKDKVYFNCIVATGDTSTALYTSVANWLQNNGEYSEERV